MKNFEKFRSRALNQNTLKEIKGGANADVPPECMPAYWNCSYLCDNPDILLWYDCVLANNPTCSPLAGWYEVCE